MTDKPKLDEDRIKEFKQYFERWNENLFDEKVEEVTQYIDDNDITKEEVEALLDAFPIKFLKPYIISIDFGIFLGLAS